MLQAADLYPAFDSSEKRLYGTPSSGNSARALPPWLDDILRVYPVAEPDNRLHFTLLTAFAPQLVDVTKRLEELLETVALPSELSPAELAQQLRPALMHTIIPMCNLALLEEAATSEGKATSLEGIPDHRRSELIRELQQSHGREAFIRKYPVLFREIQDVCTDWFTASSRFVQHLGADLPLLAGLGGRTDPGAITELRSGVDEIVHRGRATVQVGFSSGLRVVYKARALELDCHFREFLRWLRDNGAEPDLRSPTVVSFSDHGWAEFIEYASCRTTGDVRRFYRRMGAFLSVIQTLRGTGFHMSNWIAAGEHPVPLDLKFLFQTRPGRQNGKQRDDSVAESVLRTGILPGRNLDRQFRSATDRSALRGKVHGHASSHEPARNLPALNGTPAAPEDYLTEIVGSFREMSEFLHANRRALMSRGGPLSAFARDQIRFDVRPAGVYYRYLKDSYAPDRLRDFEARAGFIRSFEKAQGDDPDLLRYEIEALERGATPVFFARPGSKHLWSNTGSRIPDYFPATPLKAVAAYLDRMRQGEWERQCWYIREAIIGSAGVVTVGSQGDAPVILLHEGTEARALRIATSIGDRLKQLAHFDDSGASWNGFHLKNDHEWVLRPLSHDLFNGTAGCVWFLSYLGMVTGRAVYTELAQKALVTTRAWMRAPINVGFFAGTGGMLYLLAHLAVLWRDQSLLDQSLRLCKSLPAAIACDDKFDIIYGAAGCIGGLAALDNVTPSPLLKTLIAMSADRLLVWTDRTYNAKAHRNPPLTGFSHGAAGMAWALLRAFRICGDARYLAAAGQAIEYESSLFSAVEGNWPDLRDYSKIRGDDPRTAGVPYMIAWCHGAPGIGLARLDALDVYDNPRVRRDISAALATTCEKGFGLNSSLCHGDLGNLELLLAAHELPEYRHWAKQLQDVSVRVLDSLDSGSWKCGTPDGVQTPGLMVGLSGIGYGLLRIAAPDRVPSILSLSPPRPGWSPT